MASSVVIGSLFAAFVIGWAFGVLLRSTAQFFERL